MKERELIIKLHKDGKKQDQIARILGCSQSKVSFWIIRFNKTGSLKNKPRPGRPSNFSEEKLSLIKSKIVKKVVSRNQKFSSCNSKELRNIINKEVKKPICMRHARRILHKMGFSLITPRSKHTKNDLEKVTKFRKKFKKNLKESFWVIR
ncbi:MAG: helix-turn-helix domain-containing protein [Nanoarchaeota archaeon]|nr:helix-turn-helix domain-containing protein [Nanoarchaeota archaeon]